MSCNEWKEYKLEELCEYRKDKVKIDDINLYNYISTENMMPNKGGIEIASSLPNSKTVARYLEGDILISNIRPYFKKIWYAKNDGGNSNDVLVFKNISKDKLNNTFLYYLLSSDNFFDYVMSTAKGTKMPRGDKDAIMRYNINLPPLKEQEKIANILSSLDDKIELNNEMNKTLEEMAQSIFKRWFVDFEFPNEDGQPYKSSGGEMVDSELGMIPKGWKVDNLGSLIKIQNGYAFKSKDLKDEGDCRVIKIKNINDLKVDINNTQYIEVDLSKKIDKKYHLKSNDIIIAMTGAEVGKIGILPQTENILYLNQRVGKFVENKLGGKYYALCMLSSTDGQSLLKNKAMGSAQPNISSSAIEEFRIVLPKEDILNQFYKITNTMYEKISRNNGNNITLNILRDTILPKLMSGEIKVN